MAPKETGKLHTLELLVPGGQCANCSQLYCSVLAGTGQQGLYSLQCTHILSLYINNTTSTSSQSLEISYFYLTIVILTRSRCFVSIISNFSSKFQNKTKKKHKFRHGMKHNEKKAEI